MFMKFTQKYDPRKQEYRTNREGEKDKNRYIIKFTNLTLSLILGSKKPIYLKNS